MENAMERQQSAHVGRASAGQHAQWISGRIETLLGHYFQPDNPSELLEAAIDDWIEALLPFSQYAIKTACTNYLREEPRRRPTPGSVVAYAHKANREVEARRAEQDAILSDGEDRVACFARDRGWMDYNVARDIIMRSRSASTPPWITTQVDRALYAVRMSEMNRVLVNGQSRGEA
jgi:hypothetical protein